MATTVSTPSPMAGAVQQTKVLVLAHTASVATRNITGGPSTLYTLLGDNLNVLVASNTKVWVKLTDDISDGWTPGTTLTLIGFPLVARTVDGDVTLQFTGSYQLLHINSGLRFENGISAYASKEAGDAATAAPGTDVGVQLTHS